MFGFCVAELGFSEPSTENRLTVARLARRFPRVLSLLRAGRIHLSGLRVLAAHLTDETADALLDQASGQSKRAIEEIVARHAPRPSVPDSIRKVPERGGPATDRASEPAPLFVPAAAVAPAVRTPVVAALAPNRTHVQFTASRELRDKIEEAKALLRHQNPSGDLASILEQALTVLITKVKKERWGVGRKARATKLPEGAAKSRHVPDPIRRAVYERDGGRCSVVDSRGHRASSAGGSRSITLMASPGGGSTGSTDFGSRVAPTTSSPRSSCTEPSGRAASAGKRSHRSHRRAERERGRRRDAPGSRDPKRSRAGAESSRGSGRLSPASEPRCRPCLPPWQRRRDARCTVAARRSRPSELAGGVGQWLPGRLRRGPVEAGRSIGFTRLGQSIDSPVAALLARTSLEQPGESRAW
jgi:hypothetical protein